jgi:hypothetical protein
MDQQRRGAVAVAAVAAMVVLGLAIVGFVVATATDAGVTVNRADAMRAFYAADGGMNMAFRELMTNADCDGDGTIGTISNDGDPNDDPTIGGGRVSVSATISGANYLLTSNGRSGTARRRIASTADGLNGGTRWMLYCNWPNAVPYVLQWNGRGWSAAGPTLDVGSKIYWALLKRCTPRIELIAATSNNAREITLMAYNGRSWGNELVVSTDDGDREHRPFYIAYERASGDGLVTYRKLDLKDVYYRTWNGAAWSGEQVLTSPLTGHPLFMKLVPKPGSNEVMLAVMDDNYDLFASVWTGSAWNSTVTLETDLPHPGPPYFDTECFDIAYEQGSGRCMVAWGRTGTNSPQYAIWDGSSWSAPASAPAVGGMARWVRLAANELDNRIAMATADDQSDVNANVWSGSSWGGSVELATSLSTLMTRPVDIAWEPDGARALCVYADNDLWTPQYNLWDGTSWSARLTAPALPQAPLLMQLEPSRQGKEILLSSVIYAGQSGLTFLRWNGTEFANYTYLEPNVSGPNPREVFMLSDSPPGALGFSARVTGWSETAP